jgi:hypothetical protein
LLHPQSPPYYWSLRNVESRQNFIQQVLWSSGYDSRLGFDQISCERSPVRVRARPCSLLHHSDVLYLSFWCCCVGREGASEVLPLRRGGKRGPRRWLGGAFEGLYTYYCQTSWVPNGNYVCSLVMDRKMSVLQHRVIQAMVRVRARLRSERSTVTGASRCRRLTTMLHDRCVVRHFISFHFIDYARHHDDVLAYDPSILQFVRSVSSLQQGPK